MVANGQSAGPAGGAAPGTHRLRHALLGPPAVQVVRFLTKLLLALFVAAGEFGEVMLAGFLVFVVTQAAQLGLDEAMVTAPRLVRTTWRRLYGVLHAAGALAALVVASGWFWARALDGYPALPLLLVVLAPQPWLANLAVPAVARLVRARHYRSLLRVDLASVGALSVVTVALAAAGCGIWSLVSGWYAAALAQVVTSHRLVRACGPLEVGGPDATRRILDQGVHLAGANVARLIFQRVDMLVIGPVLGRTALGVYELALHVALVVVTYGAALSERVLLPLMARARDEARLAGVLDATLRGVVTFVLPLHVVMACAGPPLVGALLPAAWTPVASLVGVLALAAGVQCLEIAGVTALKAAGEGRWVVRLEVYRGLAAFAVLVPCVSMGLEAVAWGLLGVRVLACAATLLRARFVVRPSEGGHGPLGIVPFTVWAAVFVPAFLLLRDVLPDLPLAAALVAAACVLWLVVRSVVEPARLRAEYDVLRRGRHAP